MKSLIATIILICTSIFSFDLSGQFYSQFSSPDPGDEYWTSVSGICLLCGVSNPENAANMSLTDYATVDVPVGIASLVSFRLELNGTAPSGTYAGIVAKRISGLIDASILGSIVIKTYLNGVLRETKTGSTQLLAIGIGASGEQSINFLTSQSFNQIEITVGGLVGVGNSMNVYYGFGGGGTPLDLDIEENKTTTVADLGSAEIFQSEQYVMINNQNNTATSYKIELMNLNGAVVEVKEIYVDSHSSAIAVEKKSNETIMLIKTTNLNSTDKNNAVQIHKVLM